MELCKTKGHTPQPPVGCGALRPYVADAALGSPARVLWAGLLHACVGFV